MKEFFKEYVKSICVNGGYDSDEDLVNKITEAICDDEEIWDMIDSRIYYYLDYPDEL
jgi:hypothetical protein